MYQRTGSEWVGGWDKPENYKKPGLAAGRVFLGVPRHVVLMCHGVLHDMAQELPVRLRARFIKIEMARLVDMSPKVGVALLVNLMKKNRRDYEILAEAIKTNVTHFPTQSDLLRSRQPDIEFG